MGKRKYEDDGRTIADMSGVSTPSGFSPSSASYRKRQSEKKAVPEDDKAPPQPPETMSKRERRRFIFASVRAALLIALVFIGVIGLFLLFCVYVWFR